MPNDKTSSLVNAKTIEKVAMLARPLQLNAFKKLLLRFSMIKLYGAQERT